MPSGAAIPVLLLSTQDEVQGQPDEARDGEASALRGAKQLGGSTDRGQYGPVVEFDGLSGLSLQFVTKTKK